MSFWEVTDQNNEWFAAIDPAPVPEVQDAVQVEDRVPEIKVSIPDTKPVTMMPNVKDPVLNYRTQQSVGRGAFLPSEYNLSEIGRIEDTDGYVSQAFLKKIGLMFKEGWDLDGKNPRTVKYIKTRLAQIAQASKISTNTLFRNIGSNVIRKSNAFLLKVRKIEASGGRIRTVPGKAIPLKPVAAYFPLPAEAMRFKSSGVTIKRWKQDMPNGDTKEFPVRDIAHIASNKKDGFIFGTPTIVPVVDDIRALRKIEENLELLIYQFLFPLFQYKVGTETAPCGYTETGEREIDVVRHEIMYMPTEGGIVTPERHEIKAIGAEGRALRAEGYVDHFKKRVFSGLGVSAVDMGEGETANRATADNMSRNLVDGVKDLQQVIEDGINAEIINELLLESTFGEDVLEEDNIVKLKFREIDVDAKIKKQNHVADLFAKHAITWDEVRRYVGEEPIIVPTPEEIEAGTDTAENFPDWHKTFWKLFDEPKLLIQSIDEPYSPAAKAAGAGSALPITEQGNQEAMEQRNKQEIELEKEKTKAKVAVAKTKPKPTASKKDGVLKSTFLETKKDVVNRVSNSDNIDHDWIASLIRTQMGTSMNRLITDQLMAFRLGYAQVSPVETQQFVLSAGNARIQFRQRSEHYILRLTENLIRALKRNVIAGEQDAKEKARAVFDSLEYRTTFIEDVEVRKAKSLGKAIALRDTAGVVSVASYTTGSNPCPTCQSKDGADIDLNNLILDFLPPHHANCSCVLQQPNIQSPVQDAVEESADQPLPEQEDSDSVEHCPKCGKCAIRTNGSADTYRCNACDEIFKIDEKTAEDATLESNTESKDKGK